jgi:dipeptidyl aminopeptidase/acylaminoacyl peptidase
MSAPLSPETLIYGFEPCADPQISPDGERIVFIRARTAKDAKDSGSHLWLCNRDGSGMRRITWTGKRNGNPRWSPDGTEVAFVSDRAEPNGIFVLPMDGGEAREVTKHPSPISELAWSPDGRTVAFVASFDPANPESKKPENGAAPVRVTSRLDYKQDNRGYLDNNRTHIFLVDVDSGEKRRLTTSLHDHINPAWSPDGRTIACRVIDLNGMVSRLTLIDLATGAAKPVTWENGTITAFAWSPDGSRIVFAGDPDHTYQPDVYVLTPSSGTLRRVTGDLPCLPDGGFPTILPPSMPVWLDENRTLWHAFRAGASGLWTVDLRDGGTEQVEGEPELRSGFSVDSGACFAAQSVTSLQSNGEIAVVDLREMRREVITTTGDAVLAVSPPSRWERFDISRGGYTIEAWLLLPDSFDPAKKYPVVLDIHGGPNGHYGYAFNAMQQCLSSNGIAVVYSNPRGSSSYGRDFTMQVIGDWGGEDYLDLMAVLDRALERPYLDADRQGIYGYSYGGYMTAWTIGQNHRFKAAVCGAPCFDLESMFGTSDISHFFGALQWGGQPHEAREAYATHSPSQFAHNTRTPTLIIQGEADERCPVGQGEQMFVTLKKNGCEVEFARYPGGSHLFMRTGPAAHREDVLARTLGWFKRHLGEPV